MLEADFIRDPSSKALINANASAFAAYKASRDAQNNFIKRLNKVEAFMLKYEPVLEKLLRDTDG